MEFAWWFMCSILGGTVENWVPNRGHFLDAHELNEREDYTLESDGRLIVNKPGLYYIYSQVRHMIAHERL